MKGLARTRGAYSELVLINEQRERLFDCLNRFVRAEDEGTTDYQLVSRVFIRWQKETQVHLGDPGDGVELEDG